MKDIDEDPEMRANINLYRDDDVINALEQQLGSLSLTEGQSSIKSPADAALEKGTTKVGTQERKVVKVKRGTEQA